MPILKLVPSGWLKNYIVRQFLTLRTQRFFLDVRIMEAFRFYLKIKDINYFFLPHLDAFPLHRYFYNFVTLIKALFSDKLLDCL